MTPVVAVILANLRVPFAVLIGLVWVGSFIAALFTKEYVTLGLTTPLMLIVVTPMFANNRKGH